VRNVVQRKLRALFWKVFPFLGTALAVGFLLLYAEDDPTYYFIFLAIVTLSIFPFLVTASYAVRSSSSPHRADLAHKSSKWARITILTWISTFLVWVSIAIICTTMERGELGAPEFAQPKALTAGSHKHTLLSFLDLAIRAFFVIPLIALVSAAICLVRSFIKKKTRYRKFWRGLPYICIAGFVGPILLIFVLGWTMQSVTRKEIKNFLRTAPSDAIVKVDGRQVKDSHDIIGELSKVAPLPAHHSHPTKMVRIDIVCPNDSLTLRAGRDSRYADEYWIYYPSFRFLSKNEIGKIRSSFFETYFR